jgi:hypothetical protein
MVKSNQLTRSAPSLASVSTETCDAMNRGALSDPLFIGLTKKISDEKTGTAKNGTGLNKKDL